MKSYSCELRQIQNIGLVDYNIESNYIYLL